MNKCIKYKVQDYVSADFTGLIIQSDGRIGILLACEKHLFY